MKEVIVNANGKEVEQVQQPAVVTTEKVTFGSRVKSWFKRNKTKILIGVGAAAAFGGMAVAKTIQDKRADAAAQDEAERNQLAEEWYQRGLLEARKSPEPESVIDVEPERVDTVEY